MAKAATPYQEGRGWAMRRRVHGQDLFVSGHTSAAAAKKAMEKLVQGVADLGKPKGLGPRRTTVAQALQDIGIERLPFMKGAQQEANRFNRYGLAQLRTATPPASADPVAYRLRFLYRGLLYKDVRDASREDGLDEFSGLPKFKALLEVAAARENRSLTNMMETLLYAHCEQHGLQPPPVKTRQTKGAGK